MSKIKKANKKSVTIIVVTLLFAVVGASLLIFTKAATGTATYSISPSTGSYNIGTDFTVSIFENSGTVPVAGADAFLTYDATKLDFVSVNTTGGVFTDCPTNSSAPNPTGGNGTVKISCIKFGSTFTGNQKIGNVTFRPKVGTGSTSITFAANSAIYDESVSNVWNGVTTGGTYNLTTPDTVGPVVVWNTPAINQVIKDTQAISVNVTDDRGTVSGVNLKIGTSGTLIPMTKNVDTYTYNWNTATVADGTYNLTITATDPAGNTATGTTTRSVQVSNSKPNLVVTSITQSPATPKIGDIVTFSAVVTNSGSAATTAGASVVTGFTVDSTAITSPTTTTAIPVGGNVTVTSTWTATSGAHTINAVADKNNVVTETNETDNTKSQSFRVYKQADASDDGIVDTKDAVILSLNWGKTTGVSFTTGDFNTDGIVDTKDAVILSLNWGK